MTVNLLLGGTVQHKGDRIESSLWIDCCFFLLNFTLAFQVHTSHGSLKGRASGYGRSSSRTW